MYHNLALLSLKLTKLYKMNKQLAVVILGHGSKSADAIEDFNFIVKKTKEKLGLEHVYGAHMELAKPSFEELISELYSKELRNIVILPYFLFKGYHIKKDIPQRIERLKNKYNDLKITVETHIGKEPLLADILAKKVTEIQ